MIRKSDEGFSSKRRKMAFNLLKFEVLDLLDLTDSKKFKICPEHCVQYTEHIVLKDKYRNILIFQ